MLAAARSIEDASRTRVLSFTEADRIARQHHIDLGRVLGHLALVDTCDVNYTKSEIRCRK